MARSVLSLVFVALCSAALCAQPATVSAVPSRAIQELSDLARKTALPTPMRIVCLGDSITAVHPRRPEVKYPQMLQAALKARYGDKVEVVNAGRGGDNVLSALKRLDADVIQKQPTLVFVNLGVNDSKLAAPKYERNQVPLEKFTKGYRALIDKLRKQTKSTVVAVGTIACVDEWTHKAAMGGKRKRNYFGNPEQLKKYNAAVQDIAREMGMGYVDLYAHFLSQPDLSALFRSPDGVHCREKGQEQIALQLMRYLARKYPAGAM